MLFSSSEEEEEEDEAPAPPPPVAKKDDGVRNVKIYRIVIRFLMLLFCLALETEKIGCCRGKCES